VEVSLQAIQRLHLLIGELKVVHFGVLSNSSYMKEKSSRSLGAR
jgi:hypothetical protein